MSEVFISYWGRGALAAFGRKPRRGRRGSKSIPFIALFLFALLPASRAHDPYDSFSAVTLFPDRLELIVTVAQSTALRLVDPDRNIRGLTAEAFARNREKFEREGRTIYVLTSAKKQLAALAATAELTEENDVTFRVTYPRPSAGPLHLHAAFLVKLGEGYGGILDVNHSDNKQIGWDQLSSANPNLEVTIPAATAPSAPKKP